jgi:hypothetical protein
MGRVAMLDSSRVMWPSQPASMNPAVEWISRPRRPRLDLPSRRPTRSVGQLDALGRGAEHELAGVEDERPVGVVGDLDQLGEVLEVLLHVDDRRRCGCGTPGSTGRW